MGAGLQRAFAAARATRKPKRKPTKASLIKALEKRCDELWPEAVKLRDHRKCRYCHKSPADGIVLNAHHIESRRHKSTKWDVDNGITLCSGHHHFFAHAENNSPYWVWLEGEIGLAQIKWLRERATQTQFVTVPWLQDVETELTAAIAKGNGKP